MAIQAKWRLVLGCLGAFAPLHAAAAVVGADGWMAPPLRPGAALAAYFTIRNTGAEADRCRISGSDVTPQISLHESYAAGNVMQMRAVDGVDVPAGGEVKLEPGGYHAMLTGVLTPLAPGDTVHVQLQCDRAGSVEVAIPVVARGAR